MMYVNLFWAWGHPEVYILMLPAFGVFSEVFPTFTGKPLFAYRTMVYATVAITVLTFMPSPGCTGTICALCWRFSPRHSCSAPGS